MDPEILQALGRIAEALAAPLTALIAAGGAYLTVRVLRRRGGTPKLERIEESMSVLQSGMETMMTQLSDVQDRLEFTERVLIQRAQPRSEKREDTPV